MFNWLNFLCENFRYEVGPIISYIVNEVDDVKGPLNKEEKIEEDGINLKSDDNLFL